MNCNNNCWWIILLILFLCCGCGNGFGTALANNGGCGCGCDNNCGCCKVYLGAAYAAPVLISRQDYFSRIIAPRFFSATPSAIRLAASSGETVTWTPVARSFTEHISSRSSSSPKRTTYGIPSLSA